MAASKLLDGLGDDYHEIVSELGKNYIKAKFSGEIVDIKVHYNRPLEDFSPTLRAYIQEYIDYHERRNQVVRTADPNSDQNLRYTGVSSSSRVGTEEYDGVYIEYYLRYVDKLGIGDKVTYATAVKSVIADVFDPGLEPYSEYRPDEPIHAIYSPLSVASRMTTDIFNIMATNKLIIEVKNNMLDIYNGKKK